jgi:predicted alpha-1,6-mannanase (GH76 family)
MTVFKHLIFCSVIALAGGLTASAFNATDADIIFTSYNNAFYATNSSANNYYKLDNGSGTSPGWWTFAEEIEMAEDNYDRTGSSAARNVVTALCNGFITQNGTLWTGNNFNDDISWASIAFARAYQATGNTNFRNIAKANFDAMYSRAWDTTFTGGGLWWNTSKGSKNACISGPAAVAACYLYNIYGDSSYLNKAQDCYAWERRVLVQTNSGAIYDSISTTSGYNTWASTYNQGTFIGAANFLHRVTGLPFYYQDAILAAKYTQNSLSSAGILPVYNSGDLGGFNGIFARWMARMAKDENLWFAYGPWLNTNASAAWNVRNPNNLSWYNWKAPTPAGTNVLDSWDCSDTVVIMQVALTNAPDMLQITPAVGFTAVAQSSISADLTSVNLVLTNTGSTSFNWSLANTSAWLNVSANTGTLALDSPATNVLVNLVPSAITNLSTGRYYTSIWLTNLVSGAAQSRSFTLVVSTGNIPIAMNGYNAGMLAANTATAVAPSATAFDIPNNYCLYQAGLNGSNRGLPPDGVFTSQLDATTVFQLQPYGTTNALAVGYNYPGSATLTLATPQAYNSIAILACSANANGGVGTFVLNFTNGTHSQSFNFNAPDWFNTTANLAIQGIGRLKLGASFSAEDNGASYPNLYQTTLNLAGLGLNQSIASITFTKPVNAGAQQISSIFAVSGIPSYREPVITQQPAPANLFRFAGMTNSWVVAVNAGLPVFYNWCLNGMVIPAATNSSYQLANLQTNQSGNYTVVISNSFGVITSSIVSLTVVPVPAYPFGQAVLTDGALGYWRLDETNGIVAHDYISGNNGIYTPKVFLGQPGDKLLDTHTGVRFGYLATSDSCVTNIAMNFSTSGSATFTVEAWVNGGSQTTDAGLVTKGYGAGGEQFNLDCGGSGHAFRFFVRDASGNAHLATSGVVPNNQWHHLAGVCDEINGYVCLYVDGVNVSQTTVTPASGILSSSSPMSIGSRQSGAVTTYDSQFIGYMEEVAIYGYALSSSQVQTHYHAVKNRPPTFFNNPFSVASANAGQSYSSTLNASASDPNGDIVVFAKVSGPAWLNVGSNGSLGGIPFSTDVGTNYFAMSATDPGGLSNTATMTVVVVAAPPISLSAALQGNDLLLNWVGGIAPYQVQWTTNLLEPIWQDLNETVSSNNLLVSPTNEAAFYRVYGQ